MKVFIIIFLLTGQIVCAQKTNQYIALSDYYCAKSVISSLNAREQGKLLDELFNTAKSLEVLPYENLSYCFKNRLFLGEKELQGIKRDAILLTDVQKENFKTLFNFKYSIVTKFAYIDEKKVIFDKYMNETLKDCLLNVEFNLAYSIKKVINKLDDPHLMLKIKHENTMPPVLKEKQVFSFPFQFVQNSVSEFYIQFVPEMKHNIPLKWNQANLLEINGLEIQKVIDSIELRFGPLGSGLYGTVADYLRLYMFTDGITAFKLRSQNTNMDTTIFVGRQAILVDDYYSYFSSNKIFPNEYHKGNLHYLKFYQNNNKNFKRILKQTILNDTLVIDFRGYPREDIRESIELLLGVTSKNVDFSTEIDEKTLCFDVLEVGDYSIKRNLEFRKEISEKKLTIIGLISSLTSSYAETSVMAIKSHLGTQFTLIGQPTIGAHGTIDKVDLDKNYELQYPYHQFSFYYTKQLNEKKQIIPDISKSNKDINEWLSKLMRSK